MATQYVKLPAGKTLTMTTDASTTGSYARIKDTVYNTNGDYPTSLSASSTTVIGPFSQDRQYEVVGINGDVSLSFSVYDPTTSPTLSGATLTGTTVLPSTTSIGDVSSTELGYLNGVTSALQTQMGDKAPSASPTFTGTVVLPSTTSIGDVSSTEIGYLNNVSSAIQTQIDAKRQDANVLSEYANDGAIAFTLNDQYARLSKGSAGAYTLATPTAGAHDGKTLHIFSSSDFAHVVTCTDGVHDGVTGGAKDTLTFAAFAGASVKLFAYNGAWYVMSNNNVTVAGA